MENMGWLILSVVIFPLVVVVVGYLLKKGIDKSFKGWEKYNDLREKNLLDWQKTWQAKVCQVKSFAEELDERSVSCVKYKDLHELTNETTGLKIRVTTLEEKTKSIEKYVEENKEDDMRVKHGSDTYPETIIKSAGKTQVRYDIEETEFTEMDGTKRTCYDFSYVAIEGELTRAKIIDAIITDEIGSKDAEIALINNELASPGTEEYAAYQALRNHAKEVAAEVLL